MSLDPQKYDQAVIAYTTAYYQEFLELGRLLEGSDLAKSIAIHIEKSNKELDALGLDEDFAKARRAALDAAARLFRAGQADDAALEFRNMRWPKNIINDPAINTDTRDILRAVTADSTSASSATSNANNGTSQCFTMIDDCPKFRLLIKTALNCKDVKIKEVIIKCTDSIEILKSLNPDWLKDSRLVSPQVQEEIRSRAIREFELQSPGFSTSMTSRDLNGSVTPGITIEGDCVIYKTRGSYLQEFKDVRCVQEADLPETTLDIITNLSSQLIAELAVPDTTVREPLTAKILRP